MKNFLFDLPQELILKILNKTAIKDHGQVAKTSKLGQILADDHSQWNSMLMPQFRNSELGVAKATFLNCPEKRLDEFLEFDEAGKIVKATRKKVNELSSLTPWELANIGQQYTQDFQIILSNRILYNKLNNVQISNIVRDRIEAIKIIFSDDELCDMLNAAIIRDFAHISFEIAKIVLSTPKLYNKLSGYSICGIVDFSYVNHIEALEIISTNDEICAKFDGTMVQNLANMSIEAAKIVLSTPRLYNRLSGANIYNIAISRLEAAKLILDNSELYEKVSEEHLQYIKKMVEMMKENTAALKF